MSVGVISSKNIKEELFAENIIEMGSSESHDLTTKFKGSYAILSGYLHYVEADGTPGNKYLSFFFDLEMMNEASMNEFARYSYTVYEHGNFYIKVVFSRGFFIHIGIDQSTNGYNEYETKFMYKLKLLN